MHQSLHLAVIIVLLLLPPPLLLLMGGGDDYAKHKYVIRVVLFTSYFVWLGGGCDQEESQ